MEEKKFEQGTNDQRRDIEKHEPEPMEIKDFVPEGLGSATWVKLDGRSEIEGYTTEETVNNEGIRNEAHVDTTRGAPWGRIPSLEEMAEEVGIDFDKLIEGFEHDRTDAEMAAEFGVSEKTIFYLRDHFIHYGIDSVMGQD